LSGFLIVSPQWPANPKKVCINCSFSPIKTINQNIDANSAPSTNQANFDFMLVRRILTENGCASF